MEQMKQKRNNNKIGRPTRIPFIPTGTREFYLEQIPKQWTQGELLKHDERSFHCSSGAHQLRTKMSAEQWRSSEENMRFDFKNADLMYT